MKLRFVQRESAFTMVEIALCLAIVGFALVAIIGVLPTGMNVQRDNREETIINHDAAMWMDAIRSGARGLDDLTNYVISITVSNFGSGSAYVYGPGELTNGEKIVGILSLPKYEDVNGSTITNSVVALVRAMSGAAVEKPPQNNNDVREGGFAYRMIVENTPLATDSDLASPSARAALENSRELRLLFRWPLFPASVGNGRQVYRMLISGSTTTNQYGWPMFQPSTFVQR